MKGNDLRLQFRHRDCFSVHHHRIKKQTPRRISQGSWLLWSSLVLFLVGVVFVWLEVISWLIWLWDLPFLLICYCERETRERERELKWLLMNEFSEAEEGCDGVYVMRQGGTSVTLCKLRNLVAKIYELLFKLGILCRIFKIIGITLN